MMCEAGAHIRPDSIALGPLADLPMPAELPDFPTESYFEYGINEGIPRLLDLFDRHEIHVTAFVAGRVAERHPELIAEVAARGHECAGHGYDWVSQCELTRDEERDVISRCVDVLEKVTGRRPLGWNCHALRSSPNTVELLAELGFLYHIDRVSRDEPWLETVAGKPFVTVPYTLHLNDLMYYEFSGGSTADWLQLMKDEFDCLYEEGGRGRRMLGVPCHDRVMRAARATALERFLEYAQSHDRVWFATREQIARHVLAGAH